MPQTIALYLTDLSKTHRVSTLYRRLSGISQAHQAAGQTSPTAIHRCGWSFRAFAAR